MTKERYKLRITRETIGCRGVYKPGDIIETDFYETALILIKELGVLLEGENVQ